MHGNLLKGTVQLSYARYMGFQFFEGNQAGGGM